MIKMKQIPFRTRLRIAQALHRVMEYVTSAQKLQAPESTIDSFRNALVHVARELEQIDGELSGIVTSPVQEDRCQYSGCGDTLEERPCYEVPGTAQRFCSMRCAALVLGGRTKVLKRNHLGRSAG